MEFCVPERHASYHQVQASIPECQGSGTSTGRILGGTSCAIHEGQEMTALDVIQGACAIHPGSQCSHCWLSRHSLPPLGDQDLGGQTNTWFADHLSLGPSNRRYGGVRHDENLGGFRRPQCHPYEPAGKSKYAPIRVARSTRVQWVQSVGFQAASVSHAGQPGRRLASWFLIFRAFARAVRRVRNRGLGSPVCSQSPTNSITNAAAAIGAPTE